MYRGDGRFEQGAGDGGADEAAADDDDAQTRSTDALVHAPLLALVEQHVDEILKRLGGRGVGRQPARDVVFAEPKALVGFAGPRTIKATIRIELPKGFQTSEFLLEHGFIDRIVRRADLKSEIARVIDYCGK